MNDFEVPNENDFEIPKIGIILWDGGCIHCGHSERHHQIAIRIVGAPDKYLCQYASAGHQISPRRWKVEYPCKCTAPPFFRELVIKGKEI